MEGLRDSENRHHALWPIRAMEMGVVCAILGITCSCASNDEAQAPSKIQATFIAPPGGYTNPVSAFVCALSFAPSDDTLLVAWQNGPNGPALQRYDIEQVREIPTSGITGLKEDRDIKDVAFLPDGKRAVLGGYGRSRNDLLILWDFDTGTSVLTYSGHGSPILCVSMSSDGNRLLSGGGSWAVPSQDSPVNYGSDYSVRLWDVMTGREIQRFEGHGGVISGLAISSDGQRVLTASRRTRNLNTRQDAGESSVRLWEVETGKEVRRFKLPAEANVTSVAFGDDGAVTLASYALQEAHVIVVWNTKTGKRLRRFKTDIPTIIAVSPDGRHALWSEMQGVVVHDIATGKPVARLEVDRAMGRRPSGTIGATGNRDADVWVGWMTSAVFSGDGKWFAAGNLDGSVFLWDVSDYKWAESVQTHADSPTSGTE